VISLPLALWFADLGIALWETWLEGNTHTPLTSGPFPVTSSVFWGLIAAINTYTTGICADHLTLELRIYSTTYLGMIVYRIWYARDDVRGFIATGSSTQSPKMTRLDSVIRIVIDSALGYTLVSLTLFFSQIARSNAVYIASGAVSPLLIVYASATLTLEVLKEIQAVGIAFNLINIRVADLRNGLDASQIAYSGNTGVATPGVSFKFAAISEPSYEHNSAFSSSRGPLEKSRAIDNDSRSSV